MARRTAVSLNFVEIGDGVPVVALHGWMPDHRLVRGALEPVFATRPGYRRLYPDLPGMGKSPAPPSIASADDVLDAVQDFVDEALGEKPFLLVGNSYGGYLARALATSRPGQVRGLALLCPVGTKVRNAERTLPARQVLRPDPELVGSLDKQLAAEFGAVSVVQTPETLRRFREEIMPGLEAADTEALAVIQQRHQLSEEPERGPRFERPALIVTGRQDDVTGYADQFALLPHYPRASFAVLDVAGHNLQIEQPELLGALLEEWLTRVAAEY